MQGLSVYGNYDKCDRQKRQTNDSHNYSGSADTGLVSLVTACAGQRNGQNRKHGIDYEWAKDNGRYVPIEGCILCKICSKRQSCETIDQSDDAQYHTGNSQAAAGDFGFYVSILYGLYGSSLNDYICRFSASGAKCTSVRNLISTVRTKHGTFSFLQRLVALLYTERRILSTDGRTN